MGSLPLGLPATPPMFPDPTASSQAQGNPNLMNFMALLQKMKQNPDVFGALQQPKTGQELASPRVAPIPQAPVAPQMGQNPAQVKMDPTANVGSLPQPQAQPGPTGAPPASAQLMSMLQPKAAATYQAITGTMDFIGKQAQKKDESQKSEAANAAQALMSALESAKTTGDYRPAEHILENNEALFNKVYKGWLQKAEEAKKTKKQEKVDPEVEGFQKGLADYLGKGAATQPGQPQPPSTLAGRSGARYMIPGAAPQQAIQQQAQSQMMQQQRQQPGQPILSPEDQVKLQEAQVKLQEAMIGYQKSQGELQKAQTEQQIAQTNLETARQRGQTAQQLDSTKLSQAALNVDLKRAQLANIQAQGRNIAARGALTHKISDSYKVKFAALDQAEDILNSMQAEKRTDYSADDIRNLQQELKQAGASGYAASLNKWLSNSRYLPDSWTKPSPEQLLGDIKNYRSNLEAIRDGKIGQEPSEPDLSGGVDDNTPDDSDDPLGLLGKQ